MRCLYEYPQRVYPYEDQVATTGARSRRELEYALVDTGAFAEERLLSMLRTLYCHANGQIPPTSGTSAT